MNNFTLSKKLSVFLVAFFISINLSSQTFTDPDDLEDAVNAATNGGTFILKNGSYNDMSITFENMTTSDKPIVVKAETIGGVTLTGDSGIVLKKSSYITIEGFVFDATDAGSLIKFEGCNNIRITRNVFEQTTSSSAKWLYIGGVWDDKTYPFQYPSHNNRIDHNTFQNKAGLGHYITIDGSTDDASDVGYQSQNDRIDHNYFKNNGPRATNEQESIRIGWSEMSQSSGYTTVEFNLFEDCDGDPEIVSVKSCDNIIRHNTFISSYGTLSLRHGNRNRVEGNYFFGNGKPIGTSSEGSSLYTGGIRIYGTDHVIINNYMEGLTGTKWDAPITLTLGDAIDGQSTSWSKHFRAERVTIAYNTLVNNSHGIEIGYDNGDKYGKDLADITIANNLITGSENAMVEIIDTDNDQGDNITWINNLMYPTGSAQLLVGATTTSFDATEVVNENPFLTFDTSGDVNVYRTTASTPLYAKTISESVTEDIEGQTRPSNSNPGADHFSSESVRYEPLTTDDVGPLAIDDDDPSENLYLSSISEFVAAGGSEVVSVNSNLDWTVSESESWIAVAPTSGSNNGSFTITVDENASTSERTGIVTVTGGSLTRSLTVSQDGADLTELYDLINTGTGLPTDKVTVHSFSKENTSKNELAIKSLDKNLDTEWTADDDAVPSGDYKADGEFVIYDLGSIHSLDLIQFITTSKSDAFGVQIWVSTTGTDDADFSMILPTSGELLFTATNSTDFNQYEVDANARYVKLIGFGRFNEDGDIRESAWTAITEIEFYGSSTLSIDDNELAHKILVYPVPTSDFIHLKNMNNVNLITLYSIDGKKIMSKEISEAQSESMLDVSSVSNGSYIITLKGDQVFQSELILISHQ